MASSILTYLAALESNNNREWYQAHKADFQQANSEFEGLIQSLIFELGKNEPNILMHEPKDLTFRLVRDTRYSHDKSPYNPTFRCHISSAGKLPIPVGYYLSIRPGNRSFFGGGLFADMFKEATNMIRMHINTHAEEFKQIITEPAFQQNFEVRGESLHNVPKEFCKDHPLADFLKFKSWYIEYSVSDDSIDHSQNFISMAVEKYLLMKPFNDFLNDALHGFTMPQR
ncbi:Conserved hypothetical protein CHP02453 [Syntrophobotulus glycolicus DSM 8271]|uniref:TIGR02453 family protein n=1 Tax=Syntrophobotulus glycolicus (strain DSM 8271 / FlGlyR) TaxID=645991 RepID=F0T231_SYNGF|nr:DUF2461 domain-containing protein [Syntrophobotulus glycolicus]ADY56375.1 Conserved hypothetical protein CHP02453 [Syntrophobotulus glycolicus DSM 8271]